AVKGIADLIVSPGLINVDFADVRTVMSEMGLAMMGTGIARGDDRAQAAAEAAISNPLLDEVNLSGANGVLVNITAGPDFTMAEFDEIGRTIEDFASEDATVVIGTSLDPEMQDEVRVTVVATGLNRMATRAPVRHEARAEVVQRPQVKLVRNATTGMIDAQAMAQVETAPQAAPARRAEPAVDNSLDYLDIPAFLRRQAD
ncbi:MAG: cell division protein FtsZ, partial [Alphaproteobacteria bacterium]|nr:cell division protein FtsZ [Alphaproteobacteria bacterium]